MTHTALRAAAAAGTGPDPLDAIEAALTQVEADLGDAAATVAVVFLGEAYSDHAEEVRGAVVDALQPDVLAGVTAQGVVAGPTELETGASLSLWAAALPKEACTPLRYEAPAETAAAAWPDVPADAGALVLLADPFTFPADAFLSWVAQARPGLPVVGGLASGASRPGSNRLLLGEDVYADGAVALALGGDLRLEPLVSQGCRPIGPSYVITRAERNMIAELGGQPAAERVQQVYDSLDQADRERMRGGLHIGLVIDEYAEEHGTGDFLVRGIIGADPQRGAIAVGDLVQVGQTVRFHVRDADSADEDLRQLLHALPTGFVPDAGLLFTCNGRGSRLFDGPDHDAELVHRALGEVPLAGFFAAGELGPVGGRSHLHGFTATVLTVAAGQQQA